MPFLSTNKANFYTSFFEKGKIPYAYREIYFNNKVLRSNSSAIENDSINSITLFPNYLQASVEAKKQTKIFQKKGFAIDLTEVETPEDYQKKFCSRNFRDNTKRRLNRLENCFNIHYKMYDGHISREEHAVLMDSMHTMLKERFAQRKDNNPILDNWSYYLENSWACINQKTATLFVIFSDDTPIALSLNYLQTPIYYFGVPAFDLDYYKFSLGNLLIFKQLEWCFENGFTFFDMGYGDLEYKRQWCNTDYAFEHHLLGSAVLYGSVLKMKYKVLNYLIDHNVNKYYHRLKRVFKQQEDDVVLEDFVLEPVDKTNLTDTIAIEETEWTQLKRPIIEFLYSSKENINNLNYYKSHDNSHTFFIKGLKNVTKLTFSNQNQ